jgi:pSer/pThr/pTyr-binding forkhead associated (FHA) protein
MEDQKNNSNELKEKKEGSIEVPLDAFLVLEGIKVIPLTKVIINIGRRLENDIVIDDPRVSRYHAQLRVVNDGYELIDVNSMGGTYINGNRITKSILYPNDLISLAGVELVYKQHDMPARSDLRETSPLNPE